MSTSEILDLQTLFSSRPWTPNGVLFFAFFLQTTLFVFYSCGPRVNTHATLRASDIFDSVREDHEGVRACETSDTSGCAQIYTAGTVVNGNFNFTDLFVTCQSSDQGTNIKIKNYLNENSTFILSVNLYHEKNPTGIYSCLGTELIQAPPSVFIKDGYCEVIAQVHAVNFYASAEEPCMFEITSENPLSGTVVCESLSGMGPSVSQPLPQTLSIAEKSSFECPKP